MQPPLAGAGPAHGVKAVARCSVKSEPAQERSSFTLESLARCPRRLPALGCGVALAKDRGERSRVDREGGAALPGEAAVEFSRVEHLRDVWRVVWGGAWEQGGRAGLARC